MLETLKKYFGYDRFRPLQEEIVSNILEGKDAFVLMPTGGGKSLCYQLPALKFPGITLVVSPLIALMKDQVDALKANGIQAEFINSSLSSAEINRIEKMASSGQLKILYLAPERLALSSFQSFLKNLKVSLIAIDEAHCISEWGHDFRPDYRNLVNLRKTFPNVPVVALTATATEKVRSDIAHQLSLKDAKVFISSFNRPNLTYVVRPKKNALENLVKLLGKYKNRSAIIYCFSRKETEEVAANLSYRGLSAAAYHAGLKTDLRKETQEKFVRDEIQIIVATIAFGMGIDKPDVRLIVHYSLPKSIEGYYQETGRAGRDSLPSECVLFYSYGDTLKHNFFIRDIQDDSERAKAEMKLAQVVQYAELRTCRREFLLRYFGENHEDESCGGCDVCLMPKENIDATIISQKILSAILRTGQRFGSRHIVSVLRGSRIQKILQFRHDQLSVFGIAREISEDEIKYFITLLIAKGLILKSEGQYSTLSVSEKGKKFLKFREKIVLPKPQFEHEMKTGEEKRSGQIEYERELFEELRMLRKRLADERGVPPFVIFSDTSLQEMAYFFPKTKDNFLKISGVGTAKMEEFGEIFMQVIREYTKKNNLEERTNFSSAQGSSKRIPRRASSTFLETKKMLDSGMNLRQIAKARSLSLGTIISHIEKLRQSGEEMNIESLRLPMERFEKIKSAFEKSGSAFLSPAKELLGEDYTYEELKIARLFL